MTQNPPPPGNEPGRSPREGSGTARTAAGRAVPTARRLPAAAGRPVPGSRSYQPPQGGQYPPQGDYQPPQSGQSYPPPPGGYQPPPPQGGYQPPQGGFPPPPPVGQYSPQGGGYPAGRRLRTAATVRRRGDQLRLGQIQGQRRTLDRDLPAWRSSSACSCPFAFSGFSFNDESLVLSLLGSLVSFVVSTLFKAALTNGALSELDGQRPNFSAFFNFRNLGAVFIVAIIVGIATVDRLHPAHHPGPDRHVPDLVRTDFRDRSGHGCDHRDQGELRTDLEERRPAVPAGTGLRRPEHRGRDSCVASDCS